MRTAVTDKPETEWTYRDGGGGDLVELGTVVGHAVGLPPHFHDEDQLTFVLEGRRRFLIGGEILIVGPGRCAMIPAGAVHRSMAESSGVVCHNFYLPAGDYALKSMIDEAERLPRGEGGLDMAALEAVVARHRLARRDTSAEPEVRRRTGGAQAASGSLSREGFSRAFSRRHGLPPHAHGIVTRANQARGQLRAGAAIADAACGAGFADQSHLGRWFRKLFGVTPGSYRAAWARSQTFQTRG